LAAAYAPDAKRLRAPRTNSSVIVRAVTPCRAADALTSLREAQRGVRNRSLDRCRNNQQLLPSVRGWRAPVRGNIILEEGAARHRAGPQPKIDRKASPTPNIQTPFRDGGVL
jgi:hypothetical protein